MTNELFFKIRDTYGLNPLNLGSGEKLTENEEPDLSYFLPVGTAHLYGNMDAYGDDFIVEVPSNNPEEPDNMYLSGAQGEFETLDNNFMETIEESSSEFYKQIR